MRNTAKHILVFETDLAVGTALMKLLLQSDYSVCLTTQVEDAKSRIARESIDLLIIDIDETEQGGWELFGHMASQWALIPVILINDLVDQPQAGNLPRLAAFVEKPVDVSILLKTIEAFLAESLGERLRRFSSTAVAERFSVAASREAPGAHRLPKHFPRS
jgi:DNA-binding NtrC family response regulator